MTTSEPPQLQYFCSSQRRRPSPGDAWRFQFTAHNGVRGYDVLVRETDPSLVAMELDLYRAAGAAPTRWS